jgi:elongation factor Ts
MNEMTISVQQVKELRKATSAPVLDCKKALQNSDGEFDMAVDWLRQKGLSTAAKKAGRVANEGLVDSYIHHGNRVGVIAEVNCETDFVARSDDFRTLVHDILLHIAMSNPMCVDVDDIPADALAREKELFREKAMQEGKPENIAEKIVSGRLEKYYQQVCLLRQSFIKDEDLTIQDLVNSAIATLGENIVVHRFARFELGQ